MELISIIHDYLSDQPEIGKVMSFATLLKVGKEIFKIPNHEYTKELLTLMPKIESLYN